MVIGHYATALVAKKHAPGGPLWLFLIASILLDWLLVIFVLADIEVMEAPNVAAGSSIFASMIVDTPYSHDIVPVLGWCVAMALAAFALTRSWHITLWAAALVAIHELCDLVSGFPHYFFGPDSARLGLGLYHTAPLAALAIELVLGLACVWWFVKDSQLSTGKTVALYAVIVLGVAALLPNAI